MAVNSTTDPTSISKVPTAPASEVASCIDFSCLSAAWEAIKSFFSMLVSALRDCFCCCGADQGTPLEESPITAATQKNDPVNSGKQEIQMPLLSFLGQFKDLRKQSLLTTTQPIFSKFSGNLGFCFQIVLINESQNAMRRAVNDFEKALTQKIEEVLNKEGFLTSVQMTLLQKEVTKEIEAFNKSMKNERGDRAILLNAGEFKPLGRLEKYISVCESLEKLAKKPLIEIQDAEFFSTMMIVIDGFKRVDKISKDLDQLNAIVERQSKVLDGKSIVPHESSKAPEEENIFKNADEYLRHLVRIVGSKPFENKAAFEKNFRFLERILNLSESPLVDSKDIEQEYLAKLDEDLTSLIESTPKITPEDLEEVIKYARSEYKQFVEVIWKHLDKPIDSKAKSERVLLDLQELVSIWKDMRELSSEKLSLDEKILLLIYIAEKLPENHAIYFKYPIKDEMESSLLALGFTFFSKRILNVTNIDDQIRKVQIESSFEVLAKKLGCQAPQPPKLVMDVSMDPEFSSGLEQNEMKSMVERVQMVYYTNLEYDQREASQMAANSIISLVGNFKDPKEKKAFADKILENLDPEIAKQVSPHLPKNYK